ncbi:Rrt8p KNAG_0L00500 [Huiozyma naganishii CBS 8797]|uniref:Uncharacterized protein n=1 Tax=Huiozyma naganishii (strain ATCC MYA-139 / BCRC 22969 / CBS 8797 / KCTC 17520 / NBRC 10181 / NCYC 3082 / Yp74L-3) TaxID=1071383 RepID=J7RS07_HUIN7|nr:hypothetical protein KNAG_0L00500 [Kazachstania naganishii CBS 8797]CCK72673.1 hypothetical protein KNAG_0L00500 [Kazachstania naganishii CBS 8797]
MAAERTFDSEKSQLEYYSFRCSTERYLNQRWRRMYYLKEYFLKDFCTPRTFSFPLQGFYEVVTKSKYWEMTGLLLVCHLVLFVVIAAIIYIPLMTLLSPLMVLLGPIGVILVHIQWIIQSQAISGFVVKLTIWPTYQYRIFQMALLYNTGTCSKPMKRPGIQRSTQPAAYRGVNTDWSKRISVSMHILYVVGRFLFFLLISLIPIVGPIVVNLLHSSSRAAAYIRNYLEWRGCEPAQMKELKKVRSGLFWAFGIPATLLDLVPFISIVSAAGNTVAATKWGLELTGKGIV